NRCVFMNSLEMGLVPSTCMAQLRRPACCASTNCLHGLHEIPPAVAGSGRGRDAEEGAQWIGLVSHRIENALRQSRSYTRQQLQYAKSGNAVTRILDKAQHRQQILDVRGVEKLQPAELHERNVAACQLEFD